MLGAFVSTTAGRNIEVSRAVRTLYILGHSNGEEHAS